jgi:hypothetical protein
MVAYGKHFSHIFEQRMSPYAVLKPVIIWQKYNTTTLPNQAKMGS